MRTTHDLPPVSPVMLVKNTTLVVLMLLFRPRSAWNNPQPVRAIYGTEADLFPMRMREQECGTVAEDVESRNVKFL